MFCLPLYLILLLSLLFLLTCHQTGFFQPGLFQTSLSIRTFAHAAPLACTWLVLVWLALSVLPPSAFAPISQRSLQLATSLQSPSSSRVLYFHLLFLLHSSDDYPTFKIVLTCIIIVCFIY